MFRLEDEVFTNGELDGPVASDGYTGPFSTYDPTKGGLATKFYNRQGLDLVDVFFKGDGPWTYAR